MKILLDTNVLLDYLAQREPFVVKAREIVTLCCKDRVHGYVAAHSITDCFYIMRKMPADERKSAILSVLNLFTVIGVDRDKLIAALNNADFDDIEDCLQAVCAVDCGIDYIVTRNIKDFAGSSVPPVTPETFLSELI